MALYERLLQRREELRKKYPGKYSRERVADRVGMHAQTLVNYEKPLEQGGRVPDAEIVRKLAADYECSVAYLYEETDNPMPFNRLREAGIDPDQFKELSPETIDRVLAMPGRAEISDEEVSSMGLSLEEINDRLENARRLARQYVLIQELEKLKRKRSEDQKGNT